jgi:predicted SAM-dependent methyltransferase
VAGGIIDRFNNSYKVAAAKIAIKGTLFSPMRRLALANKIRKRSPLWVHFGCGEVADDRFINVDARYFPHVDYITKSPEMSALRPGSADLIYACHVFEHVPFRTQPKVLARWKQILKPAGKLVLSVPDFDKLLGLYSRGERDLHGVQEPLMGGQEYPGNFHFAIFTKEHLTGLLLKAGFTDVEEWRSDQEADWPRDWSWDQTVSLNLRATKP